MNDGQIRQLERVEYTMDNEIVIPASSGTKLMMMSVYARREYYRAMRARLGDSASMSCAEAAQREFLAR